MRGISIAVLGLSVAVACSSSYGAGSQGPAVTGGDAGGSEAGSLPDASPSDAGACDAAVCGRTVVARTTSGEIAGIAVDATNVYWAEGQLYTTGDLATCPKTGCAKPSVLSGSTSIVISVGGDGSSVFAGLAFNARGLYKVATATNTLELVAGGSNVREIGVRADGIYFLSLFEANNASSVQRVSPNGAGPTTLCTFTPASNAASLHLAAYGTSHVYLANASLGILYTCPMNGTASPVTPFYSTTYTDNLAATSSRVYWIANGELLSCPEGDACSTPTSELTPTNVGADLVRVVEVAGELVLATTDGQILVCDAAKCRTTARVVTRDPDFAPGEPFAHPLAADGAAIYYAAVDSRGTDGGANGWRIMRVAR